MFLKFLLVQARERHMKALSITKISSIAPAQKQTRKTLTLLFSVILIFHLSEEP